MVSFHEYLASINFFFAIKCNILNTLRFRCHQLVEKLHMVGSDVSNWLRNYTLSWSLLESFHVSSQESLQPTGHRFLSTRFVLILCAYCATDGTFNDDEPVVARGSFHTTNPIPFPKFQGNAFISTRKKRKEKSNAFIFPMKVFILKALRERGREPQSLTPE